MTSTLSWLQFDEEQARRSRELIRAISEPSTLDSIGIGTIRDGFANILFPGTSTLHTRVRYFLLVPWAMQHVATRRPRTRDQYDRWLRETEVATIDALKAAAPPGTTGIIGADRGHRVQTLPSVIYWSGLAAWGIRVAEHLSRGELRDVVLSRRETRRSDDGQALPFIVWDALPAPPEDFPQAPLPILPTQEEAEYLLGKMKRTRLTGATEEPSALAQLARHPQTVVAPDVWDLPATALTPQLGEIVEMAWGFSLTIQGARLRYLDLLFRRKAEQTGATPPTRPALDDLLVGWMQEMDAESARVARWVDRLPGLFDLLTGHGVHTQRPTREFVTAWCQNAVADPEGALASSELGDMITAREASLKKGAARLTNTSPLALWNGELLGSDRLNFRWPVAQQHVADCITAMEDAHAGS